MGSSFNLDFVRRNWGLDEASALQSMAIEEGCYRIYKYGDYGWESYKPIHYPARAIRKFNVSWRRLPHNPHFSLLASFELSALN